ncbi:hemerythrin domain-containing protein [Spirillospora sp. CA-294931]|uniref:hemerythrin domain-containing protein n=1 Tax=Spirillospora sp. CA-294931 TaxID=3240042 RepID=UPI003D8F9CFF
MSDKADNVVELLLAQHEEIRRLCSIVEKNSGQVRKEGFDRLRHLLAVHETAEEEIVHPYARRALGDGDKVVDARLEEENTAKRTLSELERLDLDSPQFQALFVQFHKDVEEHARHEEREEFPKLADRASPQELRGMVTAVKAAEAVAPTHPHPGTESVTKNVALGPLAAVADRTRDAIRKARG